MKHVYPLYRKEKNGKSKIDIDLQFFNFELKIKWTNDPRTPPPQQTHKTQLFHKDDIFLPVYVLINNQVIFDRHRAICRNVFRITINSANMGHPKHSQFLVLIYM